MREVYECRAGPVLIEQGHQTQAFAWPAIQHKGEGPS